VRPTLVSEAMMHVYIWKLLVLSSTSVVSDPGCHIAGDVIDGK
jgi:hypothetical protein